MAELSDVAADDLEILKAASVYIRSPDGSTGSGYVIAPGFIGTAWHVVESWPAGESFEVMVGMGKTRKTVQARLIPRVDEDADAAVLEVVGGLDVKPLPVASALTRRATWDGYGFPGVANKIEASSGLSLSGYVQDPNTQTDFGHPAVLLFSEQIAAGSATPLHGFSGSPVIVDGALVGHLVKHIGEVDDNRRAAFGYVYACPIARVTALLDAPPKPQAISPTPLRTQRESVKDEAPLGDKEYHVFVSYRSTDRPWAMSLVARMEGAGLKVFIDQKELEPGRYLAEQLEDAMRRSRAAVVLVSRGWLDSPWCNQEQQVLTQRAVEDKAFILVPLRLDKSEMPMLLGTRVWFDFSRETYVDGPIGHDLERLIDTLLRRSAADTLTPQAKAVEAERAMTDKFVASIRIAALGNASAIDEVLADWSKTRSDDTAPLIAAAEAYNGKALFERTLAIFGGTPRTLRVRQLTAFAKRKLGLINEACQEFEALRREGNLDAETGGLLAGTYKARWLESGDAAFMLLAYETYREAYERSGDPFNGINAAAMALQCGDVGKMHEFAGQVLEVLKKQPADKLNHWD
ncbi:MAG: TIR domain-containing protein, partial [Candidatus Methylumidiphilus sp.]